MSSAEIDALVPWVTDRQLHHWCARGYVRPSSGGSGRPRSFPEQEKRILLAMARLVRAGLVPERAAVVARQAVTRAAAEHKRVYTVRLAGKEDPGILLQIQDV
jgi:hypothetical protein